MREVKKQLLDVSRRPSGGDTQGWTAGSRLKPSQAGNFQEQRKWESESLGHHKAREKPLSCGSCPTLWCDGSYLPLWSHQHPGVPPMTPGTFSVVLLEGFLGIPEATLAVFSSPGWADFLCKGHRGSHSGSGGRLVYLCSVLYRLGLY